MSDPNAEPDFLPPMTAEATAARGEARRPANFEAAMSAWRQARYPVDGPEREALNGYVDQARRIGLLGDTRNPGRLDVVVNEARNAHLPEPRNASPDNFHAAAEQLMQRARNVERELQGEPNYPNELHGFAREYLLARAAGFAVVERNEQARRDPTLRDDADRRTNLYQRLYRWHEAPTGRQGSDAGQPRDRANQTADRQPAAADRDARIDSITDVSLRNAVQMAMNPAMRNNADLLMAINTQRIIGNTEADPDQVAAAATIVAELIQEARRQVGGMAEAQAGGLDARTLGQEFARAFHGERLSRNERYLEFLRDEEWNNKDPMPFTPETAPSYYVEMTDQEREEFKSRMELARIARFKRGGLVPPSLDTLSKYPEWNGFTKTETEMLYRVPGVREAMEAYVQLMAGRQVQGVDGNLRGAKLRSDLHTIREQIRSHIGERVQQGWTDRYQALTDGDERARYERRGYHDLANNQDILALKARDAEQIAFNLLYAGNVFESMDSQWSNGVRVRGPQVSSDLVHPVIKDQMKPLDALIASFKKDPGATSWVGKFGEWAYLHMTNNGSNRIAINDENGTAPFTRGRDTITPITVEIVPDNEQRRFWTRTGNRIFVPECYPQQMIGSFWEETEVGSGRDKHNLLYYLERGERIPWEDMDSQTPWGAYSSKLGKAGTLWEVLKGAKSLRSDLKSVDEWKTDVDNALGKFGLRNEKSLKRWLFHASVGIDVKKRTPKVALFPPDKLAMKNNLHKLGYLRYNELFLD